MGKHKSKKKKKNAQGQAHQEPGQANPLNAKEIPSKQQAERSTAAGTTHRDDKEHSMINRESSFTDWCLAVFTGLLVACTVCQIVIMNSQLDSARKDQRPWMRIDITAQPIPDKSTSVPIVANIYNSGKSPAKSVYAEVFVEVVKNGEEPNLPAKNSIAQATTGIVYPNAATPANLSYPLLEAQVPDYKEGRIFLAIYANFTYTDAFGTSHWGKVCAFAVGKAGGAYTAKKCTDYNNADDN